MNQRLISLLRKTGLKSVLIFLYRSLAKAIRPGKIWRYLESHETNKLQVGSGRNGLEGWLNTDINPVPGLWGGPVFLEVRSALYGNDPRPQILPFIYGLGGRDIFPDDIEHAFGVLEQTAQSKQRASTERRYLNLRAD